MKAITMGRDEYERVLAGKKTMIRIPVPFTVCLEPYMPAYDGVVPLYIKDNRAYVLAEICPDGQMDYNDRLVKPHYAFKEVVALKYYSCLERQQFRKAVVTDIKVVRCDEDVPDEDIRLEGFDSRQAFDYHYYTGAVNTFYHVYTFRLLPNEER